MDDQSKWFLEMETPPSKEAVKIVEMTRYDLEFYINPIDKAVAGFERIYSGLKELNSILKEFLLWVKCYQIALHAREELFLKRRVNQYHKLHCCFILRNCHSHPSLQQPPP